MFKQTEIETCSGWAVDVVNPDMATISLEDIAQSLSRLCRFNGHVSEPYYVSQHCEMVATLMGTELGYYREVCLWGLFHDAAEAFIGDIPRPVKHQFQGVKEMEEKLMEAICGRFCLPYPCPWPLTLKHCDNVALMNEAWHLMPSKGEGYNISKPESFMKLPVSSDGEKALKWRFINYFNWGHGLSLAAALSVPIEDKIKEEET